MAVFHFCQLSSSCIDNQETFFTRQGQESQTLDPWMLILNVLSGILSMDYKKCMINSTKMAE